ncbi:hypothetical protein F4778DRAFT_178343 [Xylariomycetidae sp. FL2044]|nr:hypothetical protein F4778DRAFT_178343 [Xylariomycetidae sp. FL2044]
MQFFTTIISLVIAATWATAFPRRHMAKREVGGVTICSGANATGTCHYEVYSMNECHDLPAELSGDARTFAPDNSGFFCYPHVGSCADICTSPTGCTFGAVDYYNPVKSDLATIQWDHLIQSFDCHLNVTTTAAAAVKKA